MKKIIAVAALFLFAIVTNSSAQPSKQMEIHSFGWGASNASGSQVVPVPGGKGTLKFDKRGDTFTNVVFLDSLGRTHRLSAAQPGAAGNPKPACDTPLPDACFATADKNIGMCICKPGNITNGSGDYLIGLLLPAVQKVREAANR